MEIMDNATRNEVTEAAVIQSLVENSVIRDYVKTHNPPFTIQRVLTDCFHLDDPAWVQNGVASNCDMDIIRSYVATHPGFENAEIEDYHSFGPDNGHSILVRNGNDVFVAFDGTNDMEWNDNGEGLYLETTLQQELARDRFDYYVEAYGLTRQDNIVVTGHSKGGNKAMFVAMDAENASLIDNCIALDGQGFSPEAIERWQKRYGKRYESMTDRITLISGKYDYVHELGLCIAGNRYTVDYIPWFADYADNDVGTFVGSLHGHEHLFTPVWDPDLNMYVFGLNADCEPSKLEAMLDEFMQFFMALSPEDREKGADAVMKAFQKFVVNNGVEPTQEDWIDLMIILCKCGVEIALVRALLNRIYPGLGPLLDKAYEAYLKEKRDSYSHNKKSASTTNRTLSSTGSRRNNSSGRTGNNPIGSSTTIELNREQLLELRAQFEKAFNLAQEGANNAYRAEIVAHDEGACRATQKWPHKEAENIRLIIDRIVNSFSSTDEANKKAAEEIIGVDIYNGIVSGNTVVYDGNGNYTIQPVQTSFEGYQGIRQNLSDNCTNCSLAMIIQRYYLRNYGECGFVYDDINKNDFYWSVEDRAGQMTRTLPDGHTYYADYGTASDLYNAGGGSYQSGLALRLSEHPEGVVIYGPYANGGQHAIVITQCNVNSDGSYTFFAIDPATGMETTLQETTLYSGRGCYGSVDELLSNLYDYQYISTVW